MLAPNEDVLMDEAWRFNITDYAERMSEGKWIAHRWQVFLAEVVQQAALEPNARILVAAPSRHGKSDVVSDWLPRWYLDLSPEKRVMIASYADTLATAFSRKVRNHFLYEEEAWTEIRHDQSKANDWMTPEGGGMRSAGVGGGILGMGFNLGIVDDPMKNWAEAQSATKRDSVNNWFDTTFMSRAEPGASVIVTMQRWHPKDLIGHLLEKGGWVEYRFPALSEEGKPDAFNRKPGQPLCPERYSKKEVKKRIEDMGSLKASGPMQQDPLASGGKRLQEHWFKYWDVMPEEFDEFVHTWDLTFKKGGSSYVCGEVWGMLDNDFYLLDLARAKMSFMESVRAVESMDSLWPGCNVVIEEAANGCAALNMFEERGTVPGRRGVRVKYSKEVRLINVMGPIEQGRCYLPNPHKYPWVRCFINEVTQDTGNDDQLDCMTAAIDDLRGGEGDDFVFV